MKLCQQTAIDDNALVLTDSRTISESPIGTIGAFFSEAVEAESPARLLACLYRHADLVKKAAHKRFVPSQGGKRRFFLQREDSSTNQALRSVWRALAANGFAHVNRHEPEVETLFAPRPKEEEEALVVALGKDDSCQIGWLVLFFEASQSAVVSQAEIDRWALLCQTSGQLLYKMQRNRREALRLRKEALSELNHEIRTPLNAIRNLSEWLQEDAADRHAPDLRAIRFAADHARKLLDRASKPSSANAEVFSPYDLLENLAHTHRLQAEMQGVSLRYRIGQGVPETLAGDTLQLSQVLTNLIHNALKFTEEGGVSVSVAKARPDDLNVKPLPAELFDYLRFSVEDTGIGIPETQQKAVFERYRQADDSIVRRYGGTGLGLHLVKTYVQEQGGEISLDSRFGEGTTVSVVLPFRRVNAKNSAASGYRLRVPQRVLVADDAATNLMIVARHLKAAHVDCEVASDGREALALLEKKHFDVVLLDLQMPVMDGFETLRRLRKLHGAERLRVIALSADDEPETLKSVEKAGFADFLSKPIDRDTLLRSISVQEKHATVSVEAESSGSVAVAKSDGFDLTTIQVLAGGDSAFLLDFLKASLREAEYLRETLDKAVAERDEELFKHAQHKSKSLVRTYGWNAIETQLGQMQTAFSSEGLPSLNLIAKRQIDDFCLFLNCQLQYGQA